MRDIARDRRTVRLKLERAEAKRLWLDQHLKICSWQAVDVAKVVRYCECDSRDQMTESLNYSNVKVDVCNECPPSRPHL